MIFTTAYHAAALTIRTTYTPLQVAILCNHQRSVPKTHETSMAKVTEKLNAMREEIKALEEEHEAALKAKGKGKNPDA
jgi:DNA topoisomerase-1